MFLNVPSARVMLVYDHQKWSALFISISAILNICLNLLLDQRLGASGAAIARLCSTITFFLLTYLYTRRKIIQSHLLTIIIKPLIVSLLMGIAVYSLRLQPLLITIPLGILIYIFGLWLIKEISPNDILLFKSIFINKSSHYSNRN